MLRHLSSQGIPTLARALVRLPATRSSRATVGLIRHSSSTSAERQNPASTPPPPPPQPSYNLVINDLQEKLRRSELAIIEKDRLVAAHLEQSNRVEKDIREKEKELDGLRKRLTALQIENDELKEKISELQAKVRELEVEKTVLTEKVAALKKEVGSLREELGVVRGDLTSAAATHTQDVESLNNSIADLRVTLTQDIAGLRATHTQDIASLTNRISKLESRVHPITVREIMRMIEKHVSLAVAGSKTQAKTYYNFDQIERDPTLKAKLDKMVSVDPSSGLICETLLILCFCWFSQQRSMCFLSSELSE